MRERAKIRFNKLNKGISIQVGNKFIGIINESELREYLNNNIIDYKEFKQI